MRNSGGREEPIEWLGGKRVAAFCGVGNPLGFRHTLDTCGYQTTAFREFSDHYRYARSDVESLTAWVREFEADAVVCTHKDLVKLGVDRLGDRPLWAVTVALEFLAGQQELEDRLARLLPGCPEAP